MIDDDGVTTDHELIVEQESNQASQVDHVKAQEALDTATALRAQGHYNMAVDQYALSIKWNPARAIVYARRAYALVQVNRPKEALEDCNTALQINPKCVTGYKNRGFANRDLGRLLEAFDDFSTAFKLGKDPLSQEWANEIERMIVQLNTQNEDYKERMGTLEGTIRDLTDRIQGMADFKPE